jgi:multiple sugar transport system ATP-binding protein
MTMGDRIAVMRDGVLQQVAPPRELYEHPANRYVAGFVGSPRMNFVPVTIQGTTATASGFTVELPTALGVERATMGIRPEDLSDRGQEGWPRVQMQVEVVEVLGSDQYLYGKIGGDDVIARVDPHLGVAAGDQVPLAVNLGHVHVFDADSERALL